jgi:hypothetical protein
MLAPDPRTDANQWLRHAVGNELRAEQQDTSHWMFRLRTEKPDGRAGIDEVAETAQGDLKVLQNNQRAAQHLAE